MCRSGRLDRVVGPGDLAGWRFAANGHHLVIPRPLHAWAADPREGNVIIDLPYLMRRHVHGDAFGGVTDGITDVRTAPRGVWRRIVVAQPSVTSRRRRCPPEPATWAVWRRRRRSARASWTSPQSGQACVTRQRGMGFIPMERKSASRARRAPPSLVTQAACRQAPEQKRCPLRMRQ